MKNRCYYAARSGYGFVMQEGYTDILRFGSKKERDEYINENDIVDGNINHRCWEVTTKEVVKVFGKTIDGIKYIDNVTNVVNYNSSSKYSEILKDDYSYYHLLREFVEVYAETQQELDVKVKEYIAAGYVLMQ